MVSGFTKFKERFQGFENQYVIIGGTACDLIMENEELPFRATKDVDIVLIVESITAEFGRQFWEYVKEAGYEHLNKSTGNAQFYRFASPKSKEYPYMIEIFSRNPDFIILEDDAILTPLPIDDEISSLSANHISKQDKISWYNASVMLSYMGLFKHTDTYNYYIEYIKPKINVKKLKRIVSKHSRKENEQHDRLEKGDRNTAGTSGGNRQDIVSVNGLSA